MEISFEIPMPPFSINRYTYADKRHKTKEAREWESAVLYHLERVPELKAAKEAWAVAVPAAFEVDYYFQVPQEIFFNAQGTISSKTMDLTNVEKSIQDLVFGRMLEINDKLIVDMRSCKFPGKTYKIFVKIRSLSELIQPAQ